MIVQLTIALNLRGLLTQSLSVCISLYQYVRLLIALYINITLDVSLKLLQNYLNHLLTDFLKWIWRKRNVHVPQLLMICSSYFSITANSFGTKTSQSMGQTISISSLFPTNVELCP